MSNKNSFSTKIIRGRILCNIWKSAVLGELHDPSIPQEKEFIDALAGFDIDKSNLIDERTYLKYWDGSLPEQKKREILRVHEKLLGLDHNSLYTIADLEDKSTPMTLNLRALEGYNKSESTNKKYDIKDIKTDISNECLKKLITKYINTESSAPLSNSIPSDVKDRFIENFPETILTYLVGLSVHVDLNNEAQFQAWSFDLATATLACYTKILCTQDNHFKTGTLGTQLTHEIAYLTILFFHTVPRTGRFLDHHNANQDNMVEILMKARSTYYKKLAFYGVTEEMMIFLFGLNVVPGKILKEPGLDGQWH